LSRYCGARKGSSSLPYLVGKETKKVFLKVKGKEVEKGERGKQVVASN